VCVETVVKGQGTLLEHRALLVAVMQGLTCLLAETETETLLLPAENKVSV
jgi:hypothetical protein